MLYHVTYSNSIPISKTTVLTYQHIWIYMNTCHRYIWYEKQGKVCFVIQYQCNVSVNSPQISINTNSKLLGSLSLLTITLTETTSDMICQSGMIADATSGREKLLKNII